VNEKLERIWKEAAVTILSRYFPRGTEKSRRTPILVAGVPAEYPLKTSQDRYRDLIGRREEIRKHFR
jgi:hypothetical protein